MTSRRLLIVALLGLVLVVGFALGQTGGIADRLPAEVTHSHDDSRPCVTRPECGGAWVFGTAALLLVVTVAAPTIGAAAIGTRLTSRPQLLLSRLAASRLERPPQFS